MTVQRHNQSRSISTIYKFNHGISWLVKLLILYQMPPYATAQNDGAPMPNPFGGLTIDKRVALIMVILVGVFFILGFLSVYMRHCTDHRIPSPLDFELAFALAGVGRSSRRARGLDSATIGTFPTFVYSTVKGLKIGKGALECAVCLNEFEHDDTLRLLPQCSHVFHTDCIDAWLASHTTCPVCRANLIPGPGESQSSIIQILDRDNDSDQPDIRSDEDGRQASVAGNQNGDLESPNVNSVNHGDRVNCNPPFRSRSTGFRLAGIFPRSHSTGHLLVQPSENHERFTLRLDEEARSRLMNSTLNRANSCVAFPRVRSSRRGYRSASGGTGRGRNYLLADRFVPSDRWRFSFTPSFMQWASSVRSTKTEMDYEGERSSDRLRPESQN